MFGEHNAENEQPDLLDLQIKTLIKLCGPEWKFLMGSEYHNEKSINIANSPRQIYWATMSAYHLYDGGWARTIKGKEGYLVIKSAERHYSFVEAVRELIHTMHRLLAEGRDD